MAAAARRPGWGRAAAAPWARAAAAVPRPWARAAAAGPLLSASAAAAAARRPSGRRRRRRGGRRRRRASAAASLRRRALGRGERRGASAGAPAGELRVRRRRGGAAGAGGGGAAAAGRRGAGGAGAGAGAAGGAGGAATEPEMSPPRASMIAFASATKASSWRPLRSGRPVGPTRSPKAPRRFFTALAGAVDVILPRFDEGGAAAPKGFEFCARGASKMRESWSSSSSGGGGGGGTPAAMGGSGGTRGRGGGGARPQLPGVVGAARRPGCCRRRFRRSVVLQRRHAALWRAPGGLRAAAGERARATTSTDERMVVACLWAKGVSETVSRVVKPTCVVLPCLPSSATRSGLTPSVWRVASGGPQHASRTVKAVRTCRAPLDVRDGAALRKAPKGRQPRLPSPQRTRPCRASARAACWAPREAAYGEISAEARQLGRRRSSMTPGSTRAPTSPDDASGARGTARKGDASCARPMKRITRTKAAEDGFRRQLGPIPSIDPYGSYHLPLHYDTDRLPYGARPGAATRRRFEYRELIRNSTSIVFDCLRKAAGNAIWKNA